MLLHSSLRRYQDKIAAAAPGWELIVVNREDTINADDEIEIVAGMSMAGIGGYSWELLDSLKGVRWVQLRSAGADQLPLQKMEKRGIALTTAIGVHGEPLSESIFAFILGFARGLWWSLHDQSRKFWRRATDVENTIYSPWEMHGQTIGIMGTGVVGSETARLAKAFNMRTLGFSRSGKPAAHFDVVYPLDQLDQLLSQSDFVVNILPLTSETHGLINAARFNQMKPSACYIGIGRGDTTVQQDLIDALKNKKIAFAGLDVTTPEPLPADSPLWSMDNVMITPHVAWATEHYDARVLEIFLRNLDAYLREGKPAFNVFDHRKMY